ncbi:MAG: hypothetical protein MUF13_12415 [Akkermansiaceae bacterium]|jgi:hypothetical protein|nr:hypothetical protein [Akkermansiaceae bacterium]
MKTLLPVACGACLISGIGIGWWASSSSIGKPPSPASQTDSPGPSSRPKPDLVKGDSRISRLRKLAEDPQHLDAELDSLPGSDLPELINLLAAQGGIEGLLGEERERIQLLLKRRYEESPEDTIAWILATPHPGDRRFYFESVFEIAAAKDPVKALEMAERIRRETGDGISLPPDFINKVARMGADSLLRAMALTLGKADRRSGWDVDFPADFDFKTAANGLAEMCKQRTQGEDFRTYPCNLVESWVKQDVQAAYAWVAANDAQANFFSCGLSDFFTGYAKLAEPSEYGSFAAQATLTGDLNERSWDVALNALMKNPDSSVIDAFLTAGSNQRDTGEMLTKLIDASINYYSADVLRQNLFNRLSEEQRAKYLLTAPEKIRSHLGAEPPADP